MKQNKEQTKKDQTEVFCQFTGKCVRIGFSRDCPQGHLPGAKTKYSCSPKS